MTSAIELLEQHTAEREAFMAHIGGVLRADDRVVAAGVTSSVARGDTDGLTDLDVLVIVSDEHIGDFVPARVRELERFGELVWVQEVVGNAPPGGSYLGAGFTGIGYPQCTDFCWQPLSLAAFPTPTLVLVEKQPVPRTALESITDIVMAGRADHAPPPQSPDLIPSDPTAALWTFKLAMFWRMSGVAAGSLARGRLAGAEWVMANTLTSVLEEITGERVPLGDEAGFVRLRALCAHAESLVEHARSIGAMIPDDRSWVTDTIDFMERLVDEGWRSPKTS